MLHRSECVSSVGPRSDAIRGYNANFRALGLIRYICLALCCWGALCAADVSAQSTAEDDAALVAALQRRVKAAITQGQKSVVAVVRQRQDESAAGFQVPNLGRLMLGRLPDELSPTDADFVPSDFGAGVIIDGDGRVVTTYHVLGNIQSSNYFVWWNNRPYRARVLAADGWYDLAVLTIDLPTEESSPNTSTPTRESPTPGGSTKNGPAPADVPRSGERIGASVLTPIRLGDAKQLRKGQFVVALGNPQAMARDGEASGAGGIISNLQRRAPRTPDRSNDPGGRETVHHYGTLIETDIRMDLGYSGGALVNLDGEMVGLMTAYSGGVLQPQSAGLAIPVDEYFRAALNQLKLGKSPEYGFLGIGPQPLELRLRQQGHRGAVVESVLPGTPAARTDIQLGDVITRANGEWLDDDDDLIRVIGSLPPERTVQLTLFRGDLYQGRGDVLQRDVTLAKKYLNTRRPGFATVAPPSWRGILVDYATVSVRSGSSSPSLPAEECVQIVEVARESPAWKAGIRPEMFLLRAGERRVRTPREFFAAVQGRKDEVPLELIGTQGSPFVETVSP